MSTAQRDFEILVLEGRGHAIDFLTGYSTAFRLGPPRRHDRADLRSDLPRSRRSKSQYCTSKARASEAVLSSSVIAVTSTSA
jgi:hypothetical protein